MRTWSAFGLALQMSWTILFSLLVPLLGGIWLDRWLDIKPWGVLLGMGLGILAATVGVARMAIRMFSPSRDGEADQPKTEAQSEEEPE